jgi:hypothetical protein
MIRRGWEALPGSLPMRVLIVVVIVLALLVTLHFVYTWMGDRLIDPGGGIG